MQKRKLLAGVGVVSLLVAAAWALGFFGGGDRAVAELQRMAEQAFDSNLSEAQQDALRDQFRQRMQALTPPQREAFFDANRDRWMQRAEQRMNEFFALSAEEQQKRLDEILDRTSQPREDRRADAGRGDRGRRGGRNMSEAQRDERSKRRLDRTSPKMRAQFSEFRRMLHQRANERGISNLPRWGGRGRG